MSHRAWVMGLAEVLRDRASLLVVSAASAWELYAKYRIGRLPGAGPWLEALEGHVRRLGAEFLPVDGGLLRVRVQDSHSRTRDMSPSCRSSERRNSGDER